MKAITLENFRGNDFEAKITDASTGWRSHGHWNVIFEIEFQGKTKSFSKVTTDSQFIDELSDMDLSEEKENAIIQKYFDYDVEEAILEWIETIVED